MGTELIGDHLSMGTDFVLDHLSRGIHFMWIVCPGGQRVGDWKSGDQMGSGLDCCFPLRSSNHPTAIQKAVHRRHLSGLITTVILMIKTCGSELCDLNTFCV